MEFTQNKQHKAVNDEQNNEEKRENIKCETKKLVFECY